jgi:hypothetical protein
MFEAVQGWNDMVIASGLVYRIGRRLKRGFASIVLVVLLIGLGLSLVDEETAGLPQPASELIVAAPLRW